ncbi:MAG: hypothetical protein KC414_13900, partial [Romboutsia sp.]|nr:hypothetical protein [Romboutsia sp.]
IDKIDGNRYACDKNKYLIAMWQGLQNNLNRPYKISRELYNLARDDYNANTNINFSDFEIGWIGWMASYNGRFFDGGYSGHDVNGRDYISEQIRNTEKQINSIKNIIFRHYEYDKTRLPENSIIYCDIPYKDTKQYATSKDFDHDKFWKWCRDKKLEGHLIFVSEYQAPEDFECVWQKEITNSMNQKNTYKPIEKLFRI